MYLCILDHLAWVFTAKPRRPQPQVSSAFMTDALCYDKYLEQQRAYGRVNDTL
jgi:hypothetical protein